MADDPMRHARRWMRRAVEDGAIPGGAIHVLHRGRTVWREAFGTTDGTRPATCATRYDLASLTKPLATASTLFALTARGDLLLSQPIGDLLPDVPECWKRVEVSRLLDHTSGLPPWIPCHAAGPGLDAAVSAVLATPPAAAPGEAYAYSCLGYILLARIVEVVAGKPLDRVARKRVFAPRGLDSLGFKPGPATDVAPTTSREGPEGDGPTALHGVVHDGNARSIEAGGVSVSGNAGLFGTVDDVAKFGEQLRAGGGPRRGRWSTAIRDGYLRARSTPAGHTRALFARPNPLVSAGDWFGDDVVGHSGYTGTALVIDPRTETTVALCTNAVLWEGKGDWLLVRRRVMTAIAAGLP